MVKKISMSIKNWFDASLILLSVDILAPDNHRFYVTETYYSNYIIKNYIYMKFNSILNFSKQ